MSRARPVIRRTSRTAAPLVWSAVLTSRLRDHEISLERLELAAEPRHRPRRHLQVKVRALVVYDVRKRIVEIEHRSRIGANDHRLERPREPWTPEPAMVKVTFGLPLVTCRLERPREPWTPEPAMVKLVPLPRLRRAASELQPATEAS